RNQRKAGDVDAVRFGRGADPGLGPDQHRLDQVFARRLDRARERGLVDRMHDRRPDRLHRPGRLDQLPVAPALLAHLGDIVLARPACPASTANVRLAATSGSTRPEPMVAAWVASSEKSSGVRVWTSRSSWPTSSASNGRLTIPDMFGSPAAIARRAPSGPAPG